MSLYSQSYYGQPSYGGPTYAAPAAYQYQYPQQPGHPQPIPHSPPHPVFIDPAAFRRDYSSRLDQLQFNSRPVIQSLSFYAQEYSRYADVVAQCLESHIRKVSAPPITSGLHDCSAACELREDFMGIHRHSSLCYIMYITVVRILEHETRNLHQSLMPQGYRSSRFLLRNRSTDMLTKLPYLAITSGASLDEASRLLSPRCHLQECV